MKLSYTVVEGGAIAGNARRELEKSIGQSVISPRNASIPDLLEISEDK